MNAASRVLTWVLLPFGERVVTVRRGPVAGSRMQLDLAHEKRYWLGHYEPAVEQVVTGLDLTGRTAWDVGAHIGYFTLLLARKADGVVAVEANPETAKRLRRNVELNRAQVNVVDAAVTGESGVVEFDARSGPLDSPESKVAAGGNLQVRAVTLDQLLTEHVAPAFVKLDIEGAELDALRAAPNLLAARPTIICEIHDGAEQRRAIGDVLEAAGYRLTWWPWRVLAVPA